MQQGLVAVRLARRDQQDPAEVHQDQQDPQEKAVQLAQLEKLGLLAPQALQVKAVQLAPQEKLGPLALREKLALLALLDQQGKQV